MYFAGCLLIECIPVLNGSPEKAWHVLYNVPTDNRLFGFDANDTAIGVEYCYGTKINADEAYRRYVWLMAFLCFKFELDPAHAIVGHFFLDPHRKTDPVTGLAHSRRTYEQLLHDVLDEYNECSAIAIEPPVVVPQQHTVTASVKLNLRKEKQSIKSPVASTVAPGTVLNYVGSVKGQSINGNDLWYIDSEGNYFWSGGVVST